MIQLIQHGILHHISFILSLLSHSHKCNQQNWKQDGNFHDSAHESCARGTVACQGCLAVHRRESFIGCEARKEETFRYNAHSETLRSLFPSNRKTPRLSARCFGNPALQGPDLRGRISCGAVHAVGTRTVSPRPIVGKRLQRGNATTK